VTLERSPTTVIVASAAAFLALATLGMSSCQKPPPHGPPIATKSALNPDHIALEKCRLSLAGSQYKADIRQKQDGSHIEVDLMALGEVIESEQYQSTDDAFSVVDAGGEEYVPPIPLVKYPMHIGDSWTWSGNIDTGGVQHGTKADISTSSQDLTINGGTVHNVVRIDVSLSIESGNSASPSTRKLTFWIAPDMGVVKRASGDYSEREPLGD